MGKRCIDSFMSHRYISALKISPDGRFAAFIASKCSGIRNDYDSDLHLYNLKTDTWEALTVGGKITEFIWIDDATILYTQKNRPRPEPGGGINRYYTIDAESFEIRERFSSKHEFNLKCRITERYFAVTASYHHQRDDDWDPGDYEILEEIPFWYNGKGFISGERTRLYLYDAATDRLKPVSGPFFEVKEVRYDERHDRLVYMGTSYVNVESYYSEIHIYDIMSGRDQKLVDNDRYVMGNMELAWDSIVFTATEMKYYGYHENPAFYTVRIADGRVDLLTKPDLSLGNTVMSDCRYGVGNPFKSSGDWLYFIATIRYDSQLCRLDQAGNIEVLTAMRGSTDLFDVYQEQVLFAGMEDWGLQELYRLENGQTRAVTTLNASVYEPEALNVPAPLNFINAEGVEIDGWVIKPDGYEEDRKYPVILNIHGGPKTVYGRAGVHEMQYWAGCGYFVIYCNPTGSDGRGDAFADLRGKYGTIDYDDLMAFVDAALAAYPAMDSRRLGVTGGSYGGFMTNWIIGHTHRFKAAVTQRGISNWLSDFCMSDISFNQASHDFLATPWTNGDKMWWHSPLKYADKVQTPTLFIHSDQDYHCCLADSLQMFTALKYHGVVSRLCLFKGENHELSRSGRPLNRIKNLKEMTQWFDEYLK